MSLHYKFLTGLTLKILVNYIKCVVSWVHLLWKFECKPIRIQKCTHFIFSLESLTIWCLLIKFARKTTIFGYPIFWQNRKILAPEFKSTQFFWMFQKLHMHAKFYKSTFKNKLFRQFFHLESTLMSQRIIWPKVD